MCVKTERVLIHSLVTVIVSSPPQELVCHTCESKHVHLKTGCIQTQKNHPKKDRVILSRILVVFNIASSVANEMRDKIHTTI